MKKPETECPECGERLSWKIVTNSWGAPQANGLCSKCNIILRGREAPEITKGKKMERTGKIDGVPVTDIQATDKRITQLPCNVQIGILRARQHPND